MARRACDGDGLLDAFRAAVANLEAHVDEINALNVYPVPDGDTGSNMLATVKAALEEAEATTGQPADRIAAAISFGALMGARGNSGVITSQIFRGMAEGLGGKRRFNGLDLAHALSEGARTAYGAVAKPVEGTILTVIRESADAAVIAAERDNDIETVLAATLDAAEKSVARTPSLLAILREAGVVDSGGQGLYRLFQGALLHLVGKGPASVARDRAHAGPKASTLVAHADEGFGYETMFLLQPNGAGSLDVDAIRDHLETIGESVLVAGDSRALKVHVHNERPDLVVGYGLSKGALSRISIENLDNQARDVRETKAAAFTGGDAGDGTAGSLGACHEAVRGRRTFTRQRRDERHRRRGRRDGRHDDGRRGTRAGRHRRRRRGRAGRDLPRLRGRGGHPGRAVGEPEHGRAARGDPGCRRQARSSSSRTTPTSSSPRARWSAWPIARSWSFRRATRPKASRRSCRSTRASTHRPTPAR